MNLVQYPHRKVSSFLSRFFPFWLGRSGLYQRLLGVLFNYMKIPKFGDITLCQSFSRRGSGVAVSLSFLGKKYEGQKLSAYQNYLGGDMVGCIGSDCTIPEWRNNNRVVKIADMLKKHLYGLIRHDVGVSYQELQSRAFRAY